MHNPLKLHQTVRGTVIAVTFLSCLICYAEKPQDRLLTAATHAQLNAPGLKAWHMKLDVTLFDLDGKNPHAASVEVWSANGNMKEVESQSGTTVTNLSVGGKLFRAGSNDGSFFRLDSLIEQVINPIPSEVLAAAIPATQQSNKVGGLQLDCLVPQLKPPSATISVNRPLSYCMDTGTDSLRLTVAPGRIALVRARTGVFLSKQVPVDLQVFFGDTLRDEVKITQLATYEPADGDFTPGPDMQPFSGPVDGGKGSELLGQMLSSGAPIYPQEAKQLHITGTVKFDAVIGPDGQIASLVPNGIASPLLQTAAADAVKQWLYRPLRICAVPVSIKTEITVNFNLN